MIDISAFKPYGGRVWHAVYERRQSGAVVLYCRPYRITVDGWAEYSDDYRQCKIAGWKMCVGCDRAVADIDSGN